MYSIGIYLGEKECVDAGTAGEDDQGEAHSHREHKTNFDALCEDCLAEIHENVTHDFFLTEGNAAKEANLEGDVSFQNHHAHANSK